MRRFVMGDIHGAHKALVQVLDRSGFDRDVDQLIFLGDVADGWSEVPECVDELLTIKNLVFCLGNHDQWFLDYIMYYKRPLVWTSQGGDATLEGYRRYGDIPSEHEELFRNARLFYTEDGDTKLFVHAGLRFYPFPDEEAGNHCFDLKYTNSEDLLWTRDLFAAARAAPLKNVDRLQGKFEEIYIGHTSTWSFSKTPAKRAEVWMLDQGAGWYGKLSIMDIDTKKYWQSDNVQTLYPYESGRRG